MAASKTLVSSHRDYAERLGSESGVQGLLRLARVGDSVALGRLLERHRGYLQTLCRLQIGRLLQPKVDASDVVQDTFLLAHRAFPQFGGTTEGEFLGWLRRILASQLSNTVRFYCRTQRRDVRRERELERRLGQSSHALMKALPNERTSPSQRVSRREDAVELADALERLPAHYRDVILLHHVQGLEFRDVAELMGRSVGSAEKLWLRSLAKLKGAMERET
jgi:RNA polymerase sigma-70 factor (ECF subfamily)